MNAHSPMLVMEFPKNMDSISVQLSKALSLITVEQPFALLESPIFTVFSLLHEQNALTPICVTELGISIDVRLQPSKALFPILFTEVGISIDDSAEHSWNALSPMLVTVVGILTVVSE